MKYKYLYSVGQTVYDKDGKALTIKRRCGVYNTPHYWVEQSTEAIAERNLSACPPLSEEAAEAAKKKQNAEAYEALLRETDKKYSVLSKYARNLNLLALQNKLAMTYGREKEIAEIKTILSRRTKPNPLLIGEAGCGKTAIVEELARQFCFEYLETQNPHIPIIYDLSLNSLVSGARYRGDFEERLQNILNSLFDNEDIIVFIDEIHSLNSAGKAEGACSAGQILKPALARGDIRCIGATTTEEYKEYITTDKALTRRFSLVNVSTIVGKSRRTCIENILSEYGSYFKIDTTEVNVDTLLTIIEDCIPHTVFPDNIIDIIDETLASAKCNNISKITDTEIKKTASRQHNIIIV